MVGGRERERERRERKARPEREDIPRWKKFWWGERERGGEGGKR